MSRQKWTLVVLLLILLLAAGYGYLTWPRQQRVSPQPAMRPSATAVQTRATASERKTTVRLRSDLLERTAQGPSRTLRNPFGASLPAAPKPVEVKPPPPPPPPPVVVAPVVDPLPVIPTETQVQLARFTFRGYLEKDRVKTIFLSSAEEIFVVKKGDRFGDQGQFLVVDLSATQLKIRQGDEANIIVVPLVEQATLAPKSLIRGSAPAVSPGRFTPVWRGPVGSQPAPAPAPEAQAGEDVPEQDTLSTEGVVHGAEN